jgi:trigger factor
MKVTVERGAGLERTLTVEVPSEVVLKRINSAATDIARKVNIPGGYRKLKPKVARVKQLYRNDIAQQVASDLVEENLRTAIDEQEIKVVGSPRIVDLGEIRQGKPFIYKVGVEVHPVIENPVYSGFIVPQKSTDVETEEVDDRLQKLQKEHTQVQPFEGKRLKAGLHLTLNIAPMTDDEELKERLSVTDRKVVLDAVELSEPLFEELAGKGFAKPRKVKARAGDMPVYSPAEMDDDEYTWEVSVVGAEEHLMPELDDDFANEARGLKSLLALRGSLREEIQQEKQKEADSTERASLTQQLLMANRFDLPYRTIMAMFQERMKPYEEQMEQYRASLGDEMINNVLAQQRQEQMGSASNETALYFLMDAVAAKLEIEIGDADIDEKVSALADEQGVQPTFIRGKLGEEGLANLQFELRSERVFEAVKAAGQLRPFEDFVAIMERRNKRRAMQRRRRPYSVRRSARSFRTRRAS